MSSRAAPQHPQGMEARKARLLAHEQSFSLLWMDPIATITFFTGDQKVAAHAVRAQLELVMAANPWLGARLRVDQTDRPRLAIRIPREADVDVDGAFLDAGDRGITPVMQYGEVLDAWHGTRLSPAWYAAMRNAPLFRVAVTRAGPGQFAVVVELNHIIADGDVFYKVYSMLQPGAQVMVLNPDRKADFEALARSFRGGFDQTFTPNVKRSLKPVLGALRLFCRRAPEQPCLLNVDAGWLADQKADMPRCSTNDVLTSALLSNSGVRYAVMPVNMRDRVPGIEAKDAGNYWRPQEILEDEFRTPLGVRHAVKASLERSASGKVQARRPTIKQVSRVGVVTNWTAFYRDLDLLGCTQLTHMPLMYSKQVAQSYFVIFRPAQDKIAVWCSVRDAKAMEIIEGLPMFSGPVISAP